MQIAASGGQVSSDYAAWQAKLTKAAVKSTDADGDGSVSQKEFFAALQKLPPGAPGSASPAEPPARSALDVNRDGVISLAERDSSAAPSQAVSGGLGSLLAAQIFGQAGGATATSQGLAQTAYAALERVG